MSWPWCRQAVTLDLALVWGRVHRGGWRLLQLPDWSNSGSTSGRIELADVCGRTFLLWAPPKAAQRRWPITWAAHPEIYLARKEMHFFGSDLRFGPQFFRRDLPAYLAEFDGWKGQRRVGEASVWYLFSRQAASEIKAFNPEARIIIMLREPAEMLYSLYYYFRYDGNEPLPTFEQALAAEAGRADRGQPCRQTYFAQGLAYRQVARYTEQVSRYFDTFPRDKVHVILYDDFAADVFGAYRQTLEFLGVEAKGCDPGFKPVNEARTVRSPVLRAVIGDPLVRSAAVALRRWVPHPIFTAMQRVNTRVRGLNAQVERRPPLAPELRAQLKREFAPEVERLSELLGRDLTRWSQDPGAATSGSALPVWLPQDQPAPSTDSGKAVPALAPAARAELQAASAPPPAGAPVLSVIILNYNGAPWLQRCLESLRRQTLFDQIEVIVADNASPDGSMKLAARLMDGWRNARTVQHGENLGYSGGNNRAALNARGRYLFFLNTDTWLEPDCLERMMQEMQASRAIAAAPAIMDYANGAIQSTSSRGFDIFGLLSSNAGRMEPGRNLRGRGLLPDHRAGVVPETGRVRRPPVHVR